MENDNPNKSEACRVAASTEKKSYKAPSFRFESVFEVSALACGKINATEGSCLSNRKVS